MSSHSKSIRQSPRLRDSTILDCIKNKPQSVIVLRDKLAVRPLHYEHFLSRLQELVVKKKLSFTEGCYTLYSPKHQLKGSIEAFGKKPPSVKIAGFDANLKLLQDQMELIFHAEEVECVRLGPLDEVYLTKIIGKKQSRIGRLCLGKRTYVELLERRQKREIDIVNTFKKYKDGEMVEVVLEPLNDLKTARSCKVVEALKNESTLFVETRSSLLKNAIPIDFSKAVLEQAKKAHYIGDPYSEIRKDLTALEFVTIDGADSRDFDDAVFAKKIRKGWRLWVAIADVASFIPTESALDKAAEERGNSVYFPDQVVPMLPEELSNNLCSLLPNTSRMTLCCEIDVDREGSIKSYNFYPARIISKARLTYEIVAEMLANKKSKHCLTYASVVANIDTLGALFTQLRLARVKRGAIDLSYPEGKVTINAKGEATAIELKTSSKAHHLIEECMIAANICAAKFLSAHNSGFLSRAHPSPDDAKIMEFKRLMHLLRIPTPKGSQINAKDLADIVEKSREKPFARVVRNQTLRTLKQAVYQPDNIGHYALALDFYAHFTSPIRRYADLLVHRAIYCVLDSKHNNSKTQVAQNLVDIGTHLSMTERRAENAERNINQWLKCCYMKDKIGTSYQGVISGLTDFGIFVELPEMGMDGMISLRDLKDDYYHYDPENFAFIGRRTKKRLQLGESIMVTLKSIKLDARLISFVPTEDTSKSVKNTKGKRYRASRRR